MKDLILNCLTGIISANHQKLTHAYYDNGGCEIWFQVELAHSLRSVGQCVKREVAYPGGGQYCDIVINAQVPVELKVDNAYHGTPDDFINDIYKLQGVTTNGSPRIALRISKGTQPSLPNGAEAYIVDHIHNQYYPFQRRAYNVDENTWFISIACF